MMKYAVITDTSVVDTTNSEHGASEYAARTNPDAILLPLSTEQDIINDPQHLPGRYIITDIRTAKLLDKVKIVTPGLIYGSSVTFEIRLLQTWTILEITDIVKQNIIPNTSKVSDKNITIGDKIILPSTKPPTSNITCKPNLAPNTTPTTSNGLTSTIKPPLFKPCENDDSQNKPSVCPKLHPTQTQTQTQTQLQPQPQPQVQVKLQSSQSSQSPQFVQSNHQIHPRTITTKITNMPKPVIIDSDNSDQLCNVSLEDISVNPQILSIGNQEQRKQQREKLELIINQNIALGALQEEHIIVVVPNQKQGEKYIGDIWRERYPACFVYGKPDDELLYYLNAQKSRQTWDQKKNVFTRLVIFDNCLDDAFINKQQAYSYFSVASQFKLYNIILTNNSDVICSSTTNTTTVMLHSFTPEWMTHISADFIKRYPIVKDQKTLEKHLRNCIRTNQCLVVNKNKPLFIESF